MASMPTTPTLTVSARSCPRTLMRPRSTALRMRSPSARPAESGVSRATTPNSSPETRARTSSRRTADFTRRDNEPQRLVAGRPAVDLVHPAEAVHVHERAATWGGCSARR